MLMKVTVLKVFCDKFNPSKQYPVGTVLDFDEERAKTCASMGLVELEAEKPIEPKKVVKKTTKKATK